VYLMSIANSNFEEWTSANKTYDFSKFAFRLKKMSLDGALFDQDKLNYFGKEMIAKTPLDTLFASVKEYAAKYDHPF
ncbi:MAG TPA: glutamate--tRNA ligase, partial [Firmicutes bacterium]|nr:glutamate--tRNA ligase [Bacillota bacterium]